MNLGTVISDIFKNLVSAWDKSPVGGAICTGLLIGVAIIGILVFIFLIQRMVEWITDREYEEFYIKKRLYLLDNNDSLDSFNRGILLCFSILMASFLPMIALIIYETWPLVLTGVILLGFAHITRFALRLCKRFNLHERNYKMHNKED